MTILKCLVGFSDGYVGRSDGIAYDGKLWLVPEWLEHPSEPIAIPRRMIRFDNLRPSKCNGLGIDYENILLPMTESALLGDIPAGIEYIECPEHVRVPIHEVRQH
jgi:hypothetical protein